MNMPVRGSPNYVWFTEQPLGAGATGNVYFGRHKRMGDVCAVKVFTEMARSSYIQAKTRELELVRKLNHRNVVRLLAIEQESHTKENVLIMELCSEGSVYDLLCQPKNAFGFPEVHFIVFFRDFVSGLEYLRAHGIIHRDIKPGNILCSKLDDGQLVYKLTDFGSARELDDGEQFTSMYGTEEYLHPDVYGSAVLGSASSRNRRVFNASVDIWSLGATLYHVATGQLPFQPFGGRGNKDIMYKIITEKPSGCMSGIQLASDGPIEYKKDFPDTCLLSRGLKQHLVPIIATCLDCNQQRQISFEDFFRRAKQFLSLNVVHILFTETFVLHHLYLPESAKLMELKTELAAQSEVAKEVQTLVYGHRILNEVLVDQDAVFRQLRTSSEQPVVLVRRPVENRRPAGLRKILPPVPVVVIESGNDATPNLAVDATWARDACALLMFTHTVLCNFVGAQRLLFESQKTLRDSLSSRVKRCSLKFTNARELLATASATVRLLGVYSLSGAASGASLVDSGIGARKMAWFPAAMKSPFSLPRDSGMGSSAAATSLAEVDGLFKTDLGRLERLEKHLSGQLRQINIEALDIDPHCVPACETEKCVAKSQTLVDQAKRTYEQFKKDKKEKLTYNENQVHKYEKIKLDDTVKKKALVHFENHCFPSAQRAIEAYAAWQCDRYKKCLDDVEHIERDLKKLRQLSRKLVDAMNTASGDESGHSVSEENRPVATAESTSVANSSLPFFGSSEVASASSSEVPAELQARTKGIQMLLQGNLTLLSDIKKCLDDGNNIYERLATVR